MVFQYFNISAADPQYDLQIKSALTIKPKDFRVKATLREGWTPVNVEQSLAGSVASEDTGSAVAAAKVNVSAKGKPFTILYGSNSGTCEAFARTLAADAAGHGFTASKVDTLDSAMQNLPKTEPVVIVTASYEGQPCDNAAMFYDWLQNLDKDEKLAMPYTVFGCGHSDWKQTFYHVPDSINKLMKEHGAIPICGQGNADAAKGDMMSVFQAWEDDVFWPALQRQAGVGGDKDAFGLASTVQNLEIEVSTKRASRLRADVSEAMVVTARSLTTPGGPEKRHIELQLPSEMAYRAGDYLAILPLNPLGTTRRVMTRFRLPWDAQLNISTKTGTFLPTDEPIAAHSLFSAYVELGQPATKRNISMLIEASDDEQTTRELTGLLEADFASEITDRHVTLLDLLERFPAIPLPLAAFVASLIPMRVRQYSISSSPLADAHKASLTYAVLDEESKSGHGRHVGVASNYMAMLQPGDIVHVAVRPSTQAFHPPADAENVPVIMAAAGTGLAPFRAFIQERAAMIGAGRKLAPAHLYLGSRHPTQDALYPEELAFWQTMGAVTLHPAFSRAPEHSAGFRRIDEAMRADARLLTDLWARNARVYVCGSRDVGESVKQVCLDLARDANLSAGKEAGDAALQAWFDGIRNERYATDVFA
nr:bifunctional cytochrome p450/nadph--p450 reductase [Quercus suber]